MAPHSTTRLQGQRSRASHRISWLPWQRVTCRLLLLVHVHFTCSLLLTLTFALTPTLGAPPDPSPPPAPPVPGSSNNLSKVALTRADGKANSNSIDSVDSSSGSSLTGGQKLLNRLPLDSPPLSSSYNSSSINNTNISLLSSSSNSKWQPNNSNNNSHSGNISSKSSGNKSKTRPVKSAPAYHPSDGDDIPREFPVALVTAASVAAFCILLFFLLAYIWHTRQLDSRARKLAIRLAADAENGRRALGRSASASSSTCRNCGPNGGGRLASSSSSGRYTLAPPLVRPDSVASSSHDNGGQYEPLSPSSISCGGGGGGGSNGGGLLGGDDERALVGGGPGSISGRSSVGVSESEGGDCEDVFEPASTLPVIPPDRLRGLRASAGRGAHRKWGRSRKSGSGASLEKRDSAVTDKEILTHFASRRHSTFFI